MHPWDVAKDGIASIQYIYQWSQVECIDDVEGLCDRAGCQCVGPVINCNKMESLFYEPVIVAEYAELCFQTCECLAIADTANVTNATNRIDLGEGRMVKLPENLQNAVTRLIPDGAALGHEACLTGEAAGWTSKGLAETACCSGYSFNALSAQEAFMIYGFPYISDIIAGIVTISACLPKLALQIPAKRFLMIYKNHSRRDAIRGSLTQM